MSVYIKDMDMPTDCLACRIACDKENYGVIGRPPKCPLAEAAAGDLISRADAIEVVAKEDCCGWIECKADKIYGSLNALPSAEATCATCADRAMCIMSAPDGNWKACKDYRPSAEVEPKIDHDRDWIIGCIEHDGFIHTHRFDKANQIILDALSAEAEWIPCSERLPKRDELVLVTYKTTDRIHLCRYLDDGSKNPWWSYIDDCCAWNNVVLAWMPLPKPYREDGEV